MTLKKIILNNRRKVCAALFGMSASCFLISGDLLYMEIYKRCSQRINSQNKDVIVKEEIKKAGLEGFPIKVEFFDAARDLVVKDLFWKTSYTEYDIKKKDYKIVLIEGQEKRRILRHELYHIKGRHFQKDENKPNGILKIVKRQLEEIAANIYAAHNIQL